MATGLFLAANQFGIFSGLSLWRSKHFRLNFFSRQVGFVFTPDKGTFFTDLDLDGAGLAGRVSLLDFRGRFFDQRDLFAISGDSAMAGVQIAEQLLLVGFRQRIAGLRLGNAGAGQLLDQGSGRFIQFSCEFSDGSNTGHIWFS